MVRPGGHRKFLSLARRLDRTDVELAALLTTSPATVSRLRAGKIHKMEPYLKRLEKLAGAKPAGIEDILADLKDWSTESPIVHDMVLALHRLAAGSVDV